MGCLRFFLLSFLDIFREFCESSIKSCFIRIVISPFFCSFAAILHVFVFELKWFSFVMKSKIVRSESVLSVATAIERSQNFSLVNHFLFFLLFPLIIVGTAFILIAAE